uniref:Uncharacterized protein n=1 Tax=Glossina austeni TaxID=7395 RepID=A0A1A9VPN3_GLOAU
MTLQHCQNYATTTEGGFRLKICNKNRYKIAQLYAYKFGLNKYAECYNEFYGHHHHKIGILAASSEQDLVDCSSQYRNNDGSCHFSRDAAGAATTGASIAASIDSSQESFQLYSEDAYNEHECHSENLNNGVLVAGNDTTFEGRDY